MAQETLLVYFIRQGDTTYPHSGNFRVRELGSITIDDSDGFQDDTVGDLTHTGSADVSDQNVVQSNASGINVGDIVDARYKYTFTGNDGSSGTIYFIATNGLNNYGSLIFSTEPLSPSVRYTFETFNTDGFVDYNDLVPCFAQGSMIATPSGEVPVEDLVPGALVLTMDHGPQPVRWIGRKPLDSIDLATRANLRPILIRAGALGPGAPSRDLLVSRQHRILVQSRIAMRMLGTDETLLPANKLTVIKGIEETVPDGGITYYHLLFDRHQIILSNGAWSESFFAGEQALKALSSAARQEIDALFPDIAEAARSATLARPQPRNGTLMKRLASRHAKNDQPLQKQRTQV